MNTDKKIIFLSYFWIRTYEEAMTELPGGNVYKSGNTVEETNICLENKYSTRDGTGITCPLI